MNKSILYTFVVVTAACVSGCSTPPDKHIDQSIQGLYDGALSSNGKYSLVASIQHGASLWRLEDGERIYNWNHTPGEFSQINLVALAGDGTTGITTFQREMVAWDEQSGKPIEFWQLPAVITCVELNHDGTFAIVGMDSGQAMIIDIQNKGFSWTQSYPETITACDMTAKANAITLGTQAGEVYAYQIKKTKSKSAAPQLNVELIHMLTHSYAISHVNILPEKRQLLSASRHHELVITDLKSKENIYVKELKDSSVTQSLETPHWVVVAKTTREVEFINSKTWKTDNVIHVPRRNIWKPSGVYITDIAYLNDQLIVTGSDGVTHFYFLNDEN